VVGRTLIPSPGALYARGEGEGVRFYGVKISFNALRK